MHGKGPASLPAPPPQNSHKHTHLPSHTDHAADAPRAPRARSPARRAPPRPPAPGARRPARAPAAGSNGVSTALASLLRLPLDVAAAAFAAARVVADITLRGVAAVLPPGLGDALRGEYCVRVWVLAALLFTC